MGGKGMLGWTVSFMPLPKMPLPLEDRPVQIHFQAIAMAEAMAVSHVEVERAEVFDAALAPGPGQVLRLMPL